MEKTYPNRTNLLEKISLSHPYVIGAEIRSIIARIVRTGVFRRVDIDRASVGAKRKIVLLAEKAIRAYRG